MKSVSHFSVNTIQRIMFTAHMRILTASFMDYLTCGSVSVHLVWVLRRSIVFFCTSSSLCVLCFSSCSLRQYYTVIYTLPHVSLCLQATEIWGNYKAAGRAFTKIHVSNVLASGRFKFLEYYHRFFFPQKLLLAWKTYFHELNHASLPLFSRVILRASLFGHKGPISFWWK